MKPTEAITILEDLSTTLPQVCPEKRHQAVQLGIEALRRLQHIRSYKISMSIQLLPGETPETKPPYEGHIFNHLPVQKGVSP